MLSSLRWPLAMALAFAFAFEDARSAAPIVREPGAIYLSDFGEKPLRLKLNGAVPCYFDVAMTRYAGTLRFPQVVQIEAVSDTGFRIRGNAQQGGVAAWITQDSIEGLPPDFVANVKKSEERRRMVESLIAKGEVAIGMTVDETGRSLGRPQKKTNRADKNGVQMVWEFIKYELVPQTVVGTGYNQSVTTTSGPKGQNSTIISSGPGIVGSSVLVKVPVGTLKVTFKDGIVESLDQSEGTTSGGQVSVVAPPIMVYW